jgi:hypothetical protein
MLAHGKLVDPSGLMGPMQTKANAAKTAAE